MPAPTLPVENSFEIVKIVIQASGYIIGWIVVAYGWNVSNKHSKLRDDRNNFHNRTRDDRKDVRDRLNEISSLLRNVEADVVSYLTSAETGERTSSFWTVHFGVQRVNLAVVMSTTFNTRKIENALIAYRQAITGSAVVGPTTPIKDPIARDKDMRQVSKRGNSLIRCLEERFAELYPFTPMS